MILEFFKRFFSLSTVSLATALTLSAIAAWYSILGLIAIFAAAVIPIVIMGASLEFSKVIVTIWLHRYWNKVSLPIKSYLLIAVILLALITSMGIFGFLSKAHIDQGVPTGDVASSIQLIDEKIKIERDNIENARAVIKQLDDAVNGINAKGSDREIKLRDGSSYTRSAAELALQVRRSQSKDRDSLTKQIEVSQNKIVKLQEEKAPISAKLRKVEAEVGPIKYIAALIYGDEVQNDAVTLEKAVRVVIILLVFVFDPLALVLIMASLSSYHWEFDKKPDEIETPKESIPDEPKYEQDDGPLTTDQVEQIKNSIDPSPTGWMYEKPHHPDTHPYLNQGFAGFNNNSKPIVSNNKFDDLKPLSKDYPDNIDEPVKPKKKKTKKAKNLTAATSEVTTTTPLTVDSVIDPIVNTEVTEKVKPVEEESSPKKKGKRLKKINQLDGTETQSSANIITQKSEIITGANVTPVHDMGTGYVEFEGRQFEKKALKELRPELFRLRVDDGYKVNSNFGTQFPKIATKGDLFVRVDVLPNRVYKFDGKQWLEQNKNLTQSYMDKEYIEFLISKLDKGEYDTDQLTDLEKAELEDYLNGNQNT